MEICWDSDAFHITLHWSLPRYHEEYEEEQYKIDNAYFYSIACQWSEAEERLLYIGMTYKQDVWRRMKQYGIRKCKEKYPRKARNLIISVATIEKMDGKIDEPLIRDIEALLIYSAWNQSMINERNINGYTGRLERQVLIENTGYALIPQKIFWGVSSSK